MPPGASAGTLSPSRASSQRPPSVPTLPPAVASVLAFLHLACALLCLRFLQRAEAVCHQAFHPACRPGRFADDRTAASAAWERRQRREREAARREAGLLRVVPREHDRVPARPLRLRDAHGPTAGGWFPPPSKVTNTKRVTAYAPWAAGRGAPARASPSSSATACASSGRAAISSRRRCAAVR